MKKFIKKNKKELKDEELKSILKQFDDFQFRDNEKENIKERLLAYIPYANRAIQQYENTKHKYLSLNISFLAVISFFSTFIFVYFTTNLFQRLLIIIGSFLSALFILLNLLDNLFKNPTHTLHQSTLWFYRGNVPDGRNLNISKKDVTNFLNKFHRTEEEFIKEDLKVLFTLYLYQAHYYNLALKTRKNLFKGVLLYFIFFLIQIMILPYLN